MGELCGKSSHRRSTLHTGRIFRFQAVTMMTAVFKEWAAGSDKVHG
jgi:hypothetical protein